jgi:hypothetical protein
MTEDYKLVDDGGNTRRRKIQDSDSDSDGTSLTTFSNYFLE